MDTPAEKFLARFGWQLAAGSRIIAARKRAVTELAWNRLNDLYLAWDDARWTAPRCQSPGRPCDHVAHRDSRCKGHTPE